MLTAAISTIALALTLGPQLHLGLQVTLEQAQTVDDAPTENEPDPAPTTAEPIDDTPETSETAEPVADEPAPEETLPEMLEDEISTTETLPDPEAASTAEEALIESADIEAEIAVDPVEAEVSEDTAPVQTEVQSGEIPEADWPGVLDAASAALSAARTAKGKFIQTNWDGTISTGSFALNRPGRMRFDYDDPTPVLIVSNGTTVAMEDRELETVDRVPLGSTPLGLILSTDLNVDDEVDVLSVMQNADRYGVRVEDSSGELDGTLTMVFDKSSYNLLGWLTTDGNFRTTVVDLTDVETNVRVDPRLFRLEEADDEEDER